MAERQRGGWKFRDDHTPDIGSGGRLILLALVVLILVAGLAPLVL